MRPATIFPAIALFLAAGCTSRTASPPADGEASLNDAASAQSADEAPDGWQILSSGEGDALLFGDAAAPRIRIFCEAGNSDILVNVPSFRPVGSEERMTFGSGETVTTLVADPSGDAQRGGVSATAPVPADLSALLSGPVGVNYGAQNIGPVTAPDRAMVEAFVGGCTDGESPEGEPGTPVPEPDPVSACLMQGDKRLPANRLKAIGTEPFWGANVEGRCVTYTTPEDIEGTRIWTAFSGSRDSGRWTGYLDGQRFIMRTSPQPGCSDGMSDRRYPVAVTLTIGSDTRRGCAAPPGADVWNSEQ